MGASGASCGLLDRVGGPYGACNGGYNGRLRPVYAIQSGEAVAGRAQRPIGHGVSWSDESPSFQEAAISPSDKPTIAWSGPPIRIFTTGSVRATRRTCRGGACGGLSPSRLPYGDGVSTALGGTASRLGGILCTSLHAATTNEPTRPLATAGVGLAVRSRRFYSARFRQAPTPSARTPASGLMDKRGMGGRHCIGRLICERRPVPMGGRAGANAGGCTHVTRIGATTRSATNADTPCRHATRLCSRDTLLTCSTYVLILRGRRVWRPGSLKQISKNCATTGKKALEPQQTPKPRQSLAVQAAAHKAA